MFSNKPRRAGAGVPAYTIKTLSSVQTARFPGAGLGGTVIYIHLTLDPVCSRWADAGEAVNEVNTGSAMEARLRVAFINLIFTIYTLVAWFTYALICALIVFACCSVATRV